MDSAFGMFDADCCLPLKRVPSPVLPTLVSGTTFHMGTQVRLWTSSQPLASSQSTLLTFNPVTNPVVLPQDYTQGLIVLVGA